jgi:hypothetical protein
MRRRRAAAAADEIDPVLGDEALQPHRHFVGRQRIFGLAVDQFGQAGIGLHRDQPSQFSDRNLTCSAISCGPVAQFSPISGTSSASITVAAAAISGPTSSVPVVSTVTWTKIGVSVPASLRATLAALTAALICSVSWQVSIRMPSTAAGDQAARLDDQPGLEPVIGDMAQAGQLGARPDRAQHEAFLALAEFLDRLARQLAGAAVDLKRAILQPVELASVIGEPPKLLVWTISDPASR